MIVNRNLKYLVMIPMLILYLVKKFKERQAKSLEVLKFKNLVKRVLAIFCLLVFTSYGDCNTMDPLVFNNHKKMSNDFISIKYIKSDLNHCKC
jgi:hypothetical protein